MCDANFAITGMGRSGTQFLADVLNRSPTWTVRHEPVAGFRCVREVRRRFGDYGDQYGEVNSYLRFQLLALDVRYKAVIVRDPMQIFQSMYNRGRPRLEHLNESLLALDGLIQRHVEPISFRLMTMDLATLNSIVLRCGIEDVDDLDGVRAVNTSFYTPMPTELRGKAERTLAWFRKEYGHLF